VAGHTAEDGTVARPRIPVQLTEIWNHPGTQGVEVEVADEFQEVDILLHDDMLALT